MSARRKSPVTPETVEAHMCSVDVRLEILSQVPFFGHLTPQEVAQVNRSFREVGYSAGEYIYFAGDPAEHLFVVAAGKVKLVRHTETGQEVLVEVLTPGEYFGSLSALGDAEYADTAQAQTSLCILKIGAEDFRAILQAQPSVALELLEITAARLRAAHEMVRQLSTHSVEQRLAHVLLKLGEKMGVPQEVGMLIEMPLSRHELAAMAGTTPESASRTLRQFQKEGLIRSGRRWVAIADRQRLAALAQGEPDNS